MQASAGSVSGSLRDNLVALGAQLERGLVAVQRWFDPAVRDEAPGVIQSAVDQFNSQCTALRDACMSALQDHSAEAASPADTFRILLGVCELEQAGHLLAAAVARIRTFRAVQRTHSLHNEGVLQITRSCQACLHRSTASFAFDHDVDASSLLADLARLEDEAGEVTRALTAAMVTDPRLIGVSLELIRFVDSLLLIAGRCRSLATGSPGAPLAGTPAPSRMG